MDNGTKDKYMDLEDTNKGKQVKRFKAFGKMDNSATQSTTIQTLSSSIFHENNYQPGS